MQAVRSYLFHFSMVVTIVIFITLVLPFWLLPFESRDRIIKQWVRFQVWMLKILCNLRYEVEGRENIPDGGFIVLAKHQSTWETFAFQMVFPPIVWVAKRELLFVPWFGWGLAMLDPIMIDRKSGKRALDQVIEQGSKRLGQGRCVVIFPEGTRVEAGTRRKYGSGGPLLAARTGYPVVPVAHNAGSFWGRRSHIIKPGVIRLAIGPAIDSKDKDAETIRNAAENWVENKMMELEGRSEWATLVKGGHPGKKSKTR
jgi:1-acyl-sn-glycerol-3-phosphate acyltransferase